MYQWMDTSPSAKPTMNLYPNSKIGLLPPLKHWNIMVCTLVNPHTLFSTNLGKQINTSIISEDNYIKTNTELEEIANEKESASEKMKAAAFIKCFDMKKYGQLTADLEKAYTRGKDEYPNDLVEAFNILS